jgi:enterobactin synthetase component D
MINLCDSIPIPVDTLGASSPTTIRSHRRYPLSAVDGQELPIYLLEFDRAGFSPGAFAASGIVCPASVARSVHKRQAEFYFGRLAARMALSQVTGAPDEVAIGASREPLWPTGIIGSISHNENFAAATALRRGVRSGVGIDIERIVVSEETQDALRTTAIGDDEVAYLRTLTGALPLNVLMTIVFSAKESLYKGAFAAVGRYFDFAAAVRRLR